MSFIAPNGEEWLTEEAYNGFIHKKPKKVRYKFGSPHRISLRSNCELCKNRKAVVRNYRDENVCQQCNLQLIDKF